MGETNLIENSTWLPTIKCFIKMVENYPVLYGRQIGNRITVNQAWEVIAQQLEIPSITCKRRWNEIKLKYVKILKLISSGLITTEDVMNNIAVSRFLDGTLDFLNPFVNFIPDKKIPKSIHERIERIFGLNRQYNTSAIVTHTHTQIKTLLLKQQGSKNLENAEIDTENQYLKDTISIAIQRKLKELFERETTINIPLNESINESGNCEIEEQNSATKILKQDIGLGTMSQIREQNNETDETATRKDNNVNEMRIKEEINHDIVDACNSDVMTDNQLRGFCKDMGDIIRIELSIEKHRLLKVRINALLRDMLKEDKYT